MLILELLAGGLLLYIGGEATVRGAVGLALRFGLSPLVVGAVIVGFGTSAPELVVSVEAARAGAPDIAVGNVVGSNVANMLLILGVAALVRPIHAHPTVYARDGIAVLVVTAGAIGLAFYGVITAWMGLAMILILCAHLAYVLRTGGHGEAAETEDPAPQPRALVGALLTLTGLAALVFGSHLFVEGAAGIARAAGVSEAVIGLTLVALGTSLPEIAASVAATWRGHGEIALGNVLGSNLFNLLGILGAAALVTDLAVPAEIVRFDIWVLAIATAVLVPIVLSGHRIDRREGAALVFLYVSYLAAHFGGGGSIALGS